MAGLVESLRAQEQAKQAEQMMAAKNQMTEAFLSGQATDRDLVNSGLFAPEGS